MTLVLLPETTELKSLPLHEPVPKGHVEVTFNEEGMEVFAKNCGFRFYLAPAVVSSSVATLWHVRPAGNEEDVNMAWFAVEAQVHASGTIACVSSSLAKSLTKPFEEEECTVLVRIPVLVNTKPILKGEALHTFLAKAPAEEVDVTRKVAVPITISQAHKKAKHV